MKIKSVKSKYPKLRVDVVEITPEVATWMLGFNTDNRNQKLHAIAVWARAMTNDEWAVNGGTIVFSGTPSKPGVLLDGQNRLHAVIDSGVTIHSMVAWGIPAAAQRTIDVGVKRTLADFFVMAGVVNGHVNAAAIGHLWRHENGYRAQTFAPTVDEAFGLLRTHPGISESVRTVIRSPILRYPPSLAAFLHYHFSTIDADAADVFWEQVLQGIGLERDSGPHRLHVTVQSIRDTPGKSLETVWLWAVTIKAWNAWREGRSVKVLRWSTGEKFPEAQ